MKVLLSAGMIQGGRSGVGRYVICLAEALASGHPEIELHVAGLEQDRRCFPFIPDTRWVSIPARFGGGALNLLWHQVCLPKLLRRERVDVVHIPSYRRMLAFSPVRQVATIHDCAPFILREKYDFLRGVFGRMLVPWIARRVPRILAVSDTTRDAIVRFMAVPPERVVTVYNGIDHGAFRPQSAEAVEVFRKRMNLTRPFFLYVARLEHPAKNHVRLIEAFGRLVAAGEFDGELILPGARWHGAEVVEAAVAASPARERIRLEGFVDNRDLPLWYAAAEALVFPSLMEGFGLPLLEAQACGTRVASADSTSLPEVIGPAGLLFDGLDAASIRAALVRLATMAPEERARREREGAAWAGRFTWQAHARDAVANYHLAVEGTRS
ncbi:glycosyltransferase family 1 protein [Luteolibacter sp. LG18]|uniref:glycosyltransferase family 4 protein n=1 Tax=Luteolibacter sp. LG18 TaxID=2819286 RepID=UPI0030C6D32C